MTLPQKQLRLKQQRRKRHAIGVGMVACAGCYSLLRNQSLSSSSFARFVFFDTPPVTTTTTTVSVPVPVPVPAPVVSTTKAARITIQSQTAINSAAKKKSLDHVLAPTGVVQHEKENIITTTTAAAAATATAQIAGRRTAQQQTAPPSPFANSNNNKNKDVCLYGWYGQNFNKMITLANALWYCRHVMTCHVRLDSRRDFTMGGNGSSWTQFYQTWFDYDDDNDSNTNKYDTRNDTTRPMIVLARDDDSNSNSNNNKALLPPQPTAKQLRRAGCQMIPNPSYQFFSTKAIPEPFRQQYYHQPKQNGSGGSSLLSYNPGIDLLPRFKKQYLQEACQALDSYKRQQQEQEQEQLHNHCLPSPPSWSSSCSHNRDKKDNVQVVTVHLRAMNKEGVTCTSSCAASAGEASFLDTCGYNASMVQLLLGLENITSSSSSSASNTVVVVLSDGGNPEAERTFGTKWISNHSFPVQVAMMILSDVHVANPKSMVDLLVAHWRRREEKEAAAAMAKKAATVTTLVKGNNGHPHCYHCHDGTTTATVTKKPILPRACYRGIMEQEDS